MFKIFFSILVIFLVATFVGVSVTQAEESEVISEEVLEMAPSQQLEEEIMLPEGSMEIETQSGTEEFDELNDKELLEPFGESEVNQLKEE